ncbi:multiheme c-type cytochrome [Rhodopirellula sp. JC639]|uniref:multiheme c-type cytochrome n=1 Tax=Stieleria mannarensis TaxID=2755585 RepID=UPI001604615C|nr:multiheme c-type cytochrome [Rhodopirellula sp. JC639]
MNAAVICLSVVISLICGGLVWWIKRSLLAALAVPVIVVGLVVFALPPAVVPVAAPPGDVEPEPVTPEVRDDRPTSAKLAAFRPIEVSDHGYVSSDACRDCHPQKHATWFASYHRTMTQVAEPEIVLGDFNDVKLSENGRDYHLREADGLCWVEMLDPAAIPGTAAASQRVERPIVMSTGSHHMQAYWFPIGARRTLAILPFVFLNETQEWIPRSAAFLKPTQNRVSHEIGRWNASCSRCHSTHPQEREMTDVSWDTRVAEFGISCEACHGPGQKHIEYHRNLDAIRLDANNDAAVSLPSDPIVNPENLSHVRSSQVCGQCHSVMTLKGDLDKINVDGGTFRPGNDLRESRDLWQLHSPEMEALLNNEAMHERVVGTNRGTFYADGILRVAGREYTSLEQSACFQRGEMSCLSCHQLHKTDDDTRSDKEWANDQLKPLAYGNDACVQCHDQQQYSTSHTHHMADSAGSNCYNCHMPHTAYGLLKAIRNHTITSPDLNRSMAADRPNACNQCHLDKSLKWTADHLQQWYSIEAPELDADQSDVAASILWLLKGNAANRALAAWTMGWEDAHAAAGNDWQSIYLAQLMNDPYLAVRMIARRSLKTLPGLADLDVDPLGSDSERNEAILSIIRRWDQDPHDADPALLIGPDNVVKTSRIDVIMNQRDNTPMSLAE